MIAYLVHPDPRLGLRIRAALRPGQTLIRLSDWAPALSKLARAPRAPLLLAVGAEVPGSSGAAVCELVRRYRPQLPLLLIADEAPAQLPEGVDVVSASEAPARIAALATRAFFAAQPEPESCSA